MELFELHPIRSTTSTPINIVIWRYQVEQREASTLAKQFQRLFGEETLNELGKLSRLCRREREITPFRLALSLIDSFATSTVQSIADLQRAFNALCATSVQYKPFHNQLAKRQFPHYVRLLLVRMLNELACTTLRFNSASPFARFTQISIQDGTSFAVKPALAKHFPGRFTTVSPAAVELHVNIDLLTEDMTQVVLSADSAAEAQFLPPVEALAGALLLADRGYFGKDYLHRLAQAGGHFIVRGTASMDPVILRALRPDGSEIKSYRGMRLKALAGRLSRYEVVDMDVRYSIGKQLLDCRLVASPNPKENRPRYLVTNLARDTFSVEQISDAYRLRWQIELLFKEFKSHANLHAFDTSNPHIAEGLIWASLCAAVMKRHCARMAQWMTGVSISTRKVAMCARHVLTKIMSALMHDQRRLREAIIQATAYLACNAQRAHPNRDRLSGRLKLGLEPVFAGS